MGLSVLDNYTLLYSVLIALVDFFVSSRVGKLNSMATISYRQALPVAFNRLFAFNILV